MCPFYVIAFVGLLLFLEIDDAHGNLADCNGDRRDLAGDLHVEIIGDQHSLTW